MSMIKSFSTFAPAYRHLRTEFRRTGKPQACYIGGGRAALDKRGFHFTKGYRDAYFEALGYAADYRREGDLEEAKGFLRIAARFRITTKPLLSSGDLQW